MVYMESRSPSSNDAFTEGCSVDAVFANTSPLMCVQPTMYEIMVTIRAADSLL